MDEQAEIPAELRRLWGLSAPARLGRPAELDLDQVLRTGIDLADRDGLGAVSLSKIAKTLGFTTMSLYRYVASKNELLVLIRDYAMGPPPEQSDAEQNWRAGLRQWAVANRRLYQVRPWLARVPVSAPPAGPNEVAWMERGLAVLRDTCLGWDAKVRVLTLVSGYVRNSSLLSEELGLGRAGTELDQVEAEQRHTRGLALLVDSERFPEMARLLSSGVFEAAGSEQEGDDPVTQLDFTYGLERILDGVAVAVREAGKAGEAGEAAPGDDG